MKVYIAPPAHLSRAMFRVANALERYAPAGVEVVPTEREADLLVLHVIGLEAIEYRKDKPCAVIQYCANMGRGEENHWRPLWERAVVVWSYYNLYPYMPPQANYYHAPLGIDKVFCAPYVEQTRDIMVMTLGYVNGHGNEAIQEPHVACQIVKGRAVHIGARPEGLTRPFAMETRLHIGDTELAGLYRRTKWIPGLRFVEGFELGVIEGLACGARPIVFDRPDNRFWFGDHALYVLEEPDNDLGAMERLTERLAALFATEPAPVTAAERAAVLDQFNWATLVPKFWKLVLARMSLEIL